MGYKYDKYYEIIDSMKTYYKANADMMDRDICHEVFDLERPIYTKEMNVSSTYIDPDGKCVSSLVADGCTVEGSVENCIIFRGVSVAKGASVKNCILMQGVSVGKNARLECIVADKNVKFTEGCTLIGSEKYPMAVGKNAEI
jgi:glucose-1-phosphate adenylyltransferase